jgi:hypothetical protein
LKRQTWSRLLQIRAPADPAAMREAVSGQQLEGVERRG